MGTKFLSMPVVLAAVVHSARAPKCFDAARASFRLSLMFFRVFRRHSRLVCRCYTHDLGTPTSQSMQPCLETQNNHDHCCPQLSCTCLQPIFQRRVKARAAYRNNRHEHADHRHHIPLPVRLVKQENNAYRCNPQQTLQVVLMQTRRTLHLMIQTPSVSDSSLKILIQHHLLCYLPSHSLLIYLCPCPSSKPLLLLFAFARSASERDFKIHIFGGPATGRTMNETSRGVQISLQTSGLRQKRALLEEWMDLDTTYIVISMVLITTIFLFCIRETIVELSFGIGTLSGDNFGKLPNFSSPFAN